MRNYNTKLSCIKQQQQQPNHLIDVNLFVLKSIPNVDSMAQLLEQAEVGLTLFVALEGSSRFATLVVSLFPFI